MSQVNMLDEELLAKYLANNMADFQGPLTVTKFSGGQSLSLIHI